MKQIKSAGESAVHHLRGAISEARTRKQRMTLPARILLNIGRVAALTTGLLAAVAATAQTPAPSVQPPASSAAADSLTPHR
ncbi:MAG: hypothetical protein ABI745_15900, partial [Caldimonas sp.]